jgi:hypothetical protein
MEIRNDNTDMAADALEEAILRGLKAIGMTAERHAKEDPDMAVDTGLARNSITFALSGEEANSKIYTADRGDGQGVYEGTAPNDKKPAVYLGSNVEYFKYIENGGRHIRARHVLKNAGSGHKAEYKDLMENSIKNA